MEGDLLDRTLKALDHLNRIYRLDRYLSMAAAVASFLLLFYIAVEAFTRREPKIELIAPFLGAGGLMTAAMMRIAFFFNEGRKLIAEIVTAELGRKPGQ